MKIENYFNQSNLDNYTAYLKSNGLSNASLKRKLSSLTNFQKFLAKKGIIQNPSLLNPNPSLSLDKARENENKNLSSPALSREGFRKGFNLKNLFSSSQLDIRNWKLRNYLLLTSLLIISSGIGYTLYRQAITRAKTNLAYTTASNPVYADRYLSFQGRLTDSTGNPITSSIAIRFDLFDTEPVGTGTSLYTSSSGNSQVIIPDENGIFSVTIGKSHGTEIPNSVFTENPAVYLQITAGGETMSPRQPIATVAYAINAETLQGIPPSASGLKDTVLVIDGSGNLNLGEPNPAIIASSTAPNSVLKIEGQAVLIKATDTYGGNIEINPDANGIIKLTTEGTGSTAVGGFINATNANLATGNLYNATINNTNRGYNFLNFSNYNIGTTQLSTRFSVDAYGNTYVGGTLSPTTISIGNTILTSSAAELNYLDGTLATAGTVIYGNGSNLSNTSVGVSGQILMSNASGAPVWINSNSISVGTTYSAGVGLSLSPTNVFSIDYDSTLDLNGNKISLNTGATNNWTGLQTFNPGSTNVPFAVGSSVLVTNLNAQYLNGLPSASFLQVGTTGFFNTATNGLMAIGTTAVGLGGTLTQNTNIGTSSFSLSFLGLGDTLGLYLKSTGFVGIGTTNTTSKFTLASIASEESGVLGTELLSSSNWTLNTGWTGDFTSGFTHAVGSTATLTNTLAAVSGYSYQIGYTVTNRTTGSFTISFGGNTSGGISSSSNYYLRATSTSSLVITPTTDFDGTVVLSIKRITAYSPVFAIKNSSNTNVLEIRSSNNTSNLFIGNSAGSMNTTGVNNIALGTGSLQNNISGVRNTAIGTGSLSLSDIYTDNTAVGYGSLAYNKNSKNTGVGVETLRYNTGFANTAIGYHTLIQNTTGESNTSLGVDSLRTNTTGSRNTGIGAFTLEYNTTGSNNAALGVVSLHDNTTGSNNIALKGLNKNTTGSDNIGIGSGAGNLLANGSTGNTSPDYSIYIGTNTKALYDNAQNEIVIGYNAIGNGSNSVTLGSDAVTKTILKGNIGIGTTNPTRKLDVIGDGSFTTNLSVGGTLTLPQGAQSGYVLTSDVSGNSYWAIAAPIDSFSVATNGLMAIDNTAVGLGGTLTQNTNINLSSYNLSFLGLGNTQSLYLSSTGNVGIGTTNPTSKLTIDASSGTALTISGTSFTTDIILQNNETIDNDVNGRINFDGSTPYLSLGGTTFLDSSHNFWAGDGLVGTPAYSFFNDQDIGMYRIGTNILGFSTAGTNRLTILANGNVGIGTTNPLQTLSVVGNGSISTNLSVGGTLAVTGRSVLGAGFTANATSYVSSLGIGTSATAQVFRLTANGTAAAPALSWTGDTNMGIYRGGADILRFSTAGADRLTILADGKVGIGTTDPKAPLHVMSKNYADPSLTYNSNAGIIYNFSGNELALAALDASPDSFWLQTRDEGSSAISLLLNPLGGKVGIGTTNPEYTLDVGGIAKILNPRGESALEIGLGTGSTQFAYIDLTTDTTYTDYGFRMIRSASANGGNYLYARGTGGIGIYNEELAPIMLGTGNTARVTILSDGRFGIGTTNPTGLFEIKLPDYTSLNTDSQQAIFGVGNSGWGLRLGYNSTENIGIINSLKPGVAYGKLILQDGGGYVGIGTTNPLASLHLQGSSFDNSSIRFLNTSNSNTDYWLIGDRTTSTYSYFSFEVGATKAVVIKDDGNVGIGFANPTQKIQLDSNTYGTDSGWTDASDRNLKENFTNLSAVSMVPIQLGTWTGNNSTIDSIDYASGSTINLNNTELLNRLSLLPIYHYNFIEEDEDNLINPGGKINRIGPTAQDFYKSFGLGGNDTSIRATDMAGIALAGIKSLINQVDGLSVTSTGQINIDYNVSPEVLSSLGYTDAKNEIESATYSLFDTLGNTVTRISQFGEIASAKIKAGLISATNIIADNAVIKNLRTEKLTSDKLLSPLATIDHLTSIDIQTSQITTNDLIAQNIQTTEITTQNLTSDNLIAQNIQTTEITTKDLIANNIESEKLISDKITTNELTSEQLTSDELNSREATISTLYADQIISKEGSFAEIMTQKISSLRDELTAIVASNLEEATPSAILSESENWSVAIATDSATITGDLSLTDNLVIGAQLMVAGDSQFGNAFVSNTLTAGFITISQSSIETLNTALYIQPSNTGSVHIMGETLVISDTGQVTINGDLTVTGSIFGNILAANEIETQKLTAATATIDNLHSTKINIATDSATSIATDSASIIIATQPDINLVTNSVQLVSNATSGTATLPTGKTDIIVFSDKLTENSLVYLTPVGSTKNEVVYLKNKIIIPATETTPSQSYFTASIDKSLGWDIQINWWIIN